jgi:hypothetical protein
MQLTIFGKHIHDNKIGIKETDNKQDKHKCMGACGIVLSQMLLYEPSPSQTAPEGESVCKTHEIIMFNRNVSS